MNDLGDSVVYEIINDIDNAKKCRASIGQFSSSVTKIVFGLMSIEYKMIPPFISLGGCASQVLSGMAWQEICNHKTNDSNILLHLQMLSNQNYMVKNQSYLP